MLAVWLIFEAILVIFSCAALAYVAMAASVGPWISPAVIMLSNILINKTNVFSQKKSTFSLLNQVSCNLAGLVCTAIGFMLPTLYFLDRQFFASLMGRPLYFCSLIGGCVAVGSVLGTASVGAFGRRFFGRLQDSPVSQIIVQTHEQSIKASPGGSIFAGIGISGLICLVRDGMRFGSKTILPAVTTLSGMVRPTMWAVGYTVGMKVAAPLIVGVLCKDLFIAPLAAHPEVGGVKLFAGSDQMALMAAFCAGMIVYEIGSSLFAGARVVRLKSVLGKLKSDPEKSKLQSLKDVLASPLFPAFLISVAFLVWIGFNLPQAVFIGIGSIATSVEISRFVLGYGLAPFGRFASFVMFPAIAIFALDNFQTTLLCIFVGVACAAAASLTIQRGVALLSQVEDSQVDLHHWLGVAICALAAGIVFWLLCSNLELGTHELFAQRGKTRAIMISIQSFNKILVFLGILFGWAVQKFGLSITMVFGGLMMPKDLTLGLIAGALFRNFLEKTPSWENFWTGVFVGESVLVTALLIVRLFGNLSGA